MIYELRAWDKTTNQMRGCYGFNELEREVYVCSVADDEFNGQLKTVHALRRIFDEVILMQSTGVKDRDGIEIFEGDIVKRTYLFNGGLGETHTGEVVYSEGYARYVISEPQEYAEPQTEDLRNILSDKSTHEVIGNIYENPELLEEQE